MDDANDMEEDEQLRYAIALSLQQQDTQEEHEQQEPQISNAPTSTARRNGSGSGGASLGLHSFDRKKMEKERLQRLAKRRRSDSNDDDVVEIPPPKRKISAQVPRSPSLPPFPNGSIKRTWAKGYPRTAEDIKIEEIFQKEKLELAVLSSYQWDDEWLLSKVDTRRTRLLLVAYAADDAQVCNAELDLRNSTSH